jgi:hypothetical protein
VAAGRLALGLPLDAVNGEVVCEFSQPLRQRRIALVITVGWWKHKAHKSGAVIQERNVSVLQLEDVLREVLRGHISPLPALALGLSDMAAGPRATRT